MNSQLEIAKKLLESKGYKIDLRESRTPKVMKMMDDIDSIRGASDIDTSEVERILMNHNASEDESGDEGYFSTMSDSDIIETWKEIRDLTKELASSDRELDYNVKDRFLKPREVDTREYKLKYAVDLLNKAKKSNNIDYAWELIDFLYDTMLLETSVKESKSIKESKKDFNPEGAVGMSVEQWCKREGIDMLSDIDIVGAGVGRVWRSEDVAKYKNRIISRNPYLGEGPNGTKSTFITIPVKSLK